MNYLQTIVSSRAEQMALKVRLRPSRRIKSMGPPNASFEAFTGLLRWATLEASEPPYGGALNPFHHLFE